MGSSRLSKCTGLLGAQEFPGSSRFFQGCHSLQAFSGAPRKSSQAFSGAPGRVVRVHRRFQGLPQLDAPRSFPRRSQGSTQGFQIFQVFHGFRFSRLSKRTGLLGAQEFPGSSRFFQGCHSLQAFSGAPRKSSQAFSGAQGVLSQALSGAPPIRCSQEFPPEVPGLHPRFSDFPGFPWVLPGCQSVQAS